MLDGFQVSPPKRGISTLCCSKAEKKCIKERLVEWKEIQKSPCAHQFVVKKTRLIEKSVLHKIAHTGICPPFFFIEPKQFIMPKLVCLDTCLNFRSAIDESNKKQLARYYRNEKQLARYHRFVDQVITKVRDLVIRLHALGILHRDIKPQNIVFTKNKSTASVDVYLIDFDRSRFQCYMPRAGSLSQLCHQDHQDHQEVSHRELDVKAYQRTTFCGTFAFCSPESLLGCLDPHRLPKWTLLNEQKQDTWSLGISWLYLLQGRVFGDSMSDMYSREYWLEILFRLATRLLQDTKEISLLRKIDQRFQYIPSYDSVNQKREQRLIEQRPQLESWLQWNVEERPTLLPDEHKKHVKMNLQPPSLSVAERCVLVDSLFETALGANVELQTFFAAYFLVSQYSHTQRIKTDELLNHGYAAFVFASEITDAEPVTSSHILNLISPGLVDHDPKLAASHGALIENLVPKLTNFACWDFFDQSLWMWCARKTPTLPWAPVLYLSVAECIFGSRYVQMKFKNLLVIETTTTSLTKIDWPTLAECRQRLPEFNRLIQNGLLRHVAHCFS